MSTPDAEQLALDGLAPRKRRKRAPAERTAASERPIARVVLDVQATHLGQTFDYLIDERQSESVRPGVLVRVRFGGRRVNGVVWERADRSDTPSSSLRYLERVLGPQVVVPASMREDITRIADAYGGTRANILRLAVPPPRRCGGCRMNTGGYWRPPMTGCRDSTMRCTAAGSARSPSIRCPGRGNGAVWPAGWR